MTRGEASMEIDALKLEGLLEERYATLKVEGSPDATYENWLDYCDKHKIIILHPEWLAETLNEEGMRGRICIHSPEKNGDMPGERAPWLLVSKKFAEKCLVLGGLP
jgi:hypothetical protein